MKKTGRTGRARGRLCVAWLWCGRLDLDCSSRAGVARWGEGTREVRMGIEDRGKDGSLGKGGVSETVIGQEGIG